MPRKKKSGTAAWMDPDDAPMLTGEVFDRAGIRKGGKIIQRGRSPLKNPKQAVELRLDADVLAAYRKTGRGWQARINADLRKARKLKAGKVLWHPERDHLREVSSPHERSGGMRDCRDDVAPDFSGYACLPAFTAPADR